MQGFGADEQQAIYDEARRRVLADLPDGLVDATVTVDCTNPDWGISYIFEHSDGGFHEVALAATTDVEEATVELAGEVQQDVMETLWRADWPACKWHDHAAQPKLISGEAAWVCQQSGYRIATIGHHKPPTRRR